MHTPSIRSILALTSLALSLSLWPRLLMAAPVPVAVIVPMTGDFARYGNRIRDGLTSVEAPGIRYLFEDEGCSPALAVSAYRKLAAVDGAKLFLGPWCGSPQTAVAPLIKQDSAFAVLGSSAPRAVFAQSGGRMLAVQHSIEEESIFNAGEVYRLGGRKVVIVFFENDFSRAHEKAFRDSFKGEVLETIAYTSPDLSAIKSVVMKIKRLNPDTLYVPDAFPLMHSLVKELHQIGLKSLRLFSVYSAQSEDVLRVLGPQGEGLTFSYPRIGDQEALQHFPRLAAKILAAGVAACPDGSPDCVHAYVRKNNSFDEFGVLRGELGLKSIRQGKFEWQ